VPAHRLVRSLLGYVSIARPLPSASLTMLVILGSAPSRHGIPDGSWLAALSMLLLCFGGFAVNDYFDRECDAVNRPHRPLSRKVLSPAEALGFGVLCLAAGGLLGGLGGGLPRLALAGAYAVSLVLYSPLSAAVPFYKTVYVPLAVTSLCLYARPMPLRLSFLDASFLSTVFLFVLSRELLGDLADRTGDRGRKLTLPVLLGSRITGVAVAVLNAAVLLNVLTLAQLAEAPLSLLALPCGSALAGTWAALRAESLRPPVVQTCLTVEKYGMGLSLAVYFLIRG
jgi:geranylgeranylglycerol-phosphate geranylgeranyltransferase